MMVLRNVAKIGIIQCDDEAIKNFDERGEEKD